MKCLKGKRFGRLLVLRQSLKRSKTGFLLWKCRCDCGNIKIVIGTNLTRKNNTESCGCLQKEGNNFKHGFKNTKFYGIWHSIKTRCNNINNGNYRWYGKRGITYDPKWETFLGFKEDMYMKYLYAKKQLKIKVPTIERMNVNDNYCFKNCIFIPLSKQGGNKTNNRKFKAISPEGKEYISSNQYKFSKQYNLNQSNISRCLQGKQGIHKKWLFLLVA
jgi:hypothetical protein